MSLDACRDLYDLFGNPDVEFIDGIHNGTVPGICFHSSATHSVYFVDTLPDGWHTTNQCLYAAPQYVSCLCNLSPPPSIPPLAPSPLPSPIAPAFPPSPSSPKLGIEPSSTTVVMISTFGAMIGAGVCFCCWCLIAKRRYPIADDDRTPLAKRKKQNQRRPEDMPLITFYRL